MKTAKIMITACLLAAGAAALRAEQCLAQVPGYPDQSDDNGLQARLEAQERHRALMKAHRKRIIETGKNDHAHTPEEYSPELELYSKPTAATGGTNNFRQTTAVPPAGVSDSQHTELRTDIRLESEKAGPGQPDWQYVSKRMHSETGTAAKIDMKPYVAEVSRKIKAGWFPPARQPYKVVRVSFVVTPQGQLANLKVTQSSGHAQVDEAARQAVLRAAPFAPLPAGCDVPKLIDYSFEHTSHQDEPSYQPGIH